MKKLYFFLAMMIVAFAASATSLTINVGAYDDATGDEDWGDDLTAEATISNGVVTIPNFLSSGKSISFTCYDDGTAAHNWGTGWVNGSSTFNIGTFGEYNYVYLYGNEGEYTDAEYCDDEDGKYIYFGVYFYVDAWEWYDLYINLPDDFEPTVYVEPTVLEGTATAKVYSLENGATVGDPFDAELGYKLTDNQLQITNAFGKTDLAAYLSYTLNADGTVTPAVGQGDSYWYTKVGAYTVNGVSYDRLYDRAGSYDKANNTYVWDVTFGLSSDNYANLVDYRVILPLPAEFAAGDNNEETASTGLIIEIGAYDEATEEDEWGDDITVEDYTIKNGVVTIPNFLSSGKSISITCYDDGSAAHNWGTGWVNGSSSFNLGTFGEYNYVYLYGNEGEYVDAEYYDDEDGKYIYFGAYFYVDAWEWFDIYILLPDDFEPTAYVEPAEPVVISKTVNALVYLREGENANGDPAEEQLSYTLTDNQLSFTDVFGHTEYSDYLSYTLNEDGSVDGKFAVGGYFTKDGTWTLLGTTYDRFIDNGRKYDVANNTFIWNVSFAFAADSYASTSDFQVVVPLPDEFGAGVNAITVDNDNNAPVEYFNLQGIRVANPENGLYIRRQGKSVTKVILK